MAVGGFVDLAALSRFGLIVALAADAPTPPSSPTPSASCAAAAASEGGAALNYTSCTWAALGLH